MCVLFCCPRVSLNERHSSCHQANHIQFAREQGSDSDACVPWRRVSLNERRSSCGPANQLFVVAEGKERSDSCVGFVYAQVSLNYRSSSKPVLSKLEREQRSQRCVFFLSHARIVEQATLLLSPTKPVLSKKEREQRSHSYVCFICARVADRAALVFLSSSKPFSNQ